MLMLLLPPPLSPLFPPYSSRSSLVVCFGLRRLGMFIRRRRCCRLVSRDSDGFEAKWHDKSDDLNPARTNSASG